MTTAAAMPETMMTICFTSVHATACTPPRLVYTIIGTQMMRTVIGRDHSRMAEMTTAGAASVTPSDIARPTRKSIAVNVRTRTSNRCSRYSYAVKTFAR